MPRTECYQLRVVKYLLYRWNKQSESHRESSVDWPSVSMYVTNNQRWGCSLNSSTSKTAFVLSWPIHYPQTGFPAVLKHNAETFIIFECMYKKQ